MNEALILGNPKIMKRGGLWRRNRQDDTAGGGHGLTGAARKQARRERKIKAAGSW